MPEQNNPKRWRPRLSVRILLIVITLSCVYLACWGATKNQGVEDVTKHFSGDYPPLDGSANLPLIVEIDVWDFDPNDDDGLRKLRRYYFWFFGYVAKLPYERELHDDFLPSYYEEFHLLPPEGDHIEGLRIDSREDLLDEPLD